MTFGEQDPVGVRGEHVAISRRIAHNVGTPGGPLDLIPPYLRTYFGKHHPAKFGEDPKTWLLTILRLLEKISTFLNNNITMFDIQTHMEAAYKVYNLDRETLTFDYELLLHAFGSLSILSATSATFHDSSSLEVLLDGDFVELLKQTVGNDFRFFINKGYLGPQQFSSYSDLNAWALKIRELLQQIDWDVERARELIQRTIRESGQKTLSVLHLEAAKIIAIQEDAKLEMLLEFRLRREFSPDDDAWLDDLDKELNPDTTRDAYVNVHSGNDATGTGPLPAEDIVKTAGIDETAPTQTAQDSVEHLASPTRGTKRSREDDTEDTEQDDHMLKKRRTAATCSRRTRGRGHH
ncbi:hypothetical protein HII31_00523 [Pseudocercospora fuligena]|uniref:Uncharacterized protein n=1 Tax=Pseudocercospora fuligena TaxID=685502 RepID=A0A8H6RVH0_9PEZI|nr:hypothetical protein HII31_00523 [Pseudocercospora fuligena]